MASGLQTSPARHWRAFLLLAISPVSVLVAAPAGRTVRPAPSYVQFGQPDQAEGAKILRGFRGMGIAGDYFLEFKLRVMPRRGSEQEFKGQLWGSLSETGPLSRISLASAGVERRFLLKNGPVPAGWDWTAASGQVAPLEVSSLFAPIIPGTQLTVFDLQMPYLYWEDFVFEGVSKIRGRPAHTFLLYPTAEFVAGYPGLSAVRVHLDTQFNALVQTELIDEKGRPYKSLSVLDLKKVGEQWMVKTIDLRDERSRDKTRFQVTGAALSLELAPTVFELEALAESVTAPRQIIAIGP